MKNRKYIALTSGSLKVGYEVIFGKGREAEWRLSGEFHEKRTRSHGGESATVDQTTIYGHIPVNVICWEKLPSGTVNCFWHYCAKPGHVAYNWIDLESRRRVKRSGMIQRRELWHRATSPE